MSKNNRKIKISELKNPVILLATGFGSGLSPIAPGTMGTLASIIPVYFLQQQPYTIYLIITLIVLLTGNWICGSAAKQLQVHDHAGIVFDELAGFLITMLLAPTGWLWMLAGFILFRLFDILKPWPISWLDKNVAGGFGIMIDDIVAGFFSLICLWILQINLQ